ncbi:Conserved_hypothetical protein [Hexamita inflata]|uniref:Transmembrane protein n=1 Tax=Hexamita inflata TaxID=28002 RepID=A0ABP1J500_9EUKA
MDKNFSIYSLQPHLDQIVLENSLISTGNYCDLKQYEKQYCLLEKSGSTIIISSNLEVLKWQKLKSDADCAFQIEIFENIEIIVQYNNIIRFNELPQLNYLGKVSLQRLCSADITEIYPIKVKIYKQLLIVIFSDSSLMIIQIVSVFPKISDHSFQLLSFTKSEQYSHIECVNNTIYLISQRQIQEFVYSNKILQFVYSYNYKNPIISRINNNILASLHYTLDTPKNIDASNAYTMILFDLSTSKTIINFQIDVSAPSKIDLGIETNEYVIHIFGNFVVSQYAIDKISKTVQFKRISNQCIRFATINAQPLILDTKNQIVMQHQTLYQLEDKGIINILCFQVVNQLLYVGFTNFMNGKYQTQIYVYSNHFKRIIDCILLDSSSSNENLPISVTISQIDNYLQTKVCVQYYNKLEILFLHDKQTKKVIFAKSIKYKFDKFLVLRQENSLQIILDE